MEGLAVSRRPCAALALSIYSLGVFRLSFPGAVDISAPSAPATRHVSDLTDCLVALEGAPEADDDCLLRVGGGSAKDLPVSIRVVAYEQDGVALVEHALGGDGNGVHGVGEWPRGLIEGVAVRRDGVHDG